MRNRPTRPHPTATLARTRATTSCLAQQQCRCCRCCSPRRVWTARTSCALTSSSQSGRFRCTCRSLACTRRLIQRQLQSAMPWPPKAWRNRRRQRGSPRLPTLKNRRALSTRAAVAMASICCARASRSTSRTRACRRRCCSRWSHRTCCSTCGARPLEKCLCSLATHLCTHLRQGLVAGTQVQMVQ